MSALSDLDLAGVIDECREAIAAERDQLGAENAALRAQLGAYRRHCRGAVHHISGDPHDNRPENLRVVELPARVKLKP